MQSKKQNSMKKIRISTETAIFIFLTAILAHLILFVALLAKGYTGFAIAALCAILLYAFITSELIDKKKKQ